MGIQSGSATFTRFFVPDPVTEDFWSYVDEKLQAGSFKGIEEGEEQAAGFASWDDFFDSSFPYGSYHKGEYVAFNFRLDQRKVPAIITKQYVREAVQKFRQEHDEKWPSRRERADIQENIKNFLLNRSFPQPSACEVVWNPAGKWMIVGTTSTKMMEAFLELFESLFRLYPMPLYHVHWGLNMIPLDERSKDVLNSMVSVKSPQAMEEGRYLGHEFLTWFWFLTEQTDGVIRISDEKQVEVNLGERLVLTLPGEGKERVICTTQANALHEARTALQQGKMVEELQMFLRIGENEYLLTMDSSLWAVKGLKAPKQLPDFDKDDPDGRFLEKMYFIEEITAAINAIYGQFLSQRLGPGWESDTLPVFKQWIAGNAEEGERVRPERSREVEAEPAGTSTEIGRDMGTEDESAPF